MLISPSDLNQTINSLIAQSQKQDFSNFSSLLEVAFALNMSYKLIPDIMQKLGQEKVQKRERDILDDWEAEISDRKKQKHNLSNDKDKEKLSLEIGKFENAISLLKDESKKETKRYKISLILSKIAPYFGLLSIILLFIAALGFCPLEHITDNKETLIVIRTVIVFIIIIPNIIAVWLQVSHWKKINSKLDEKFHELEERLLNF